MAYESGVSPSFPGWDFNSESNASSIPTPTIDPNPNTGNSFTPQTFWNHPYYTRRANAIGTSVHSLLGLYGFNSSSGSDPRVPFLSAAPSISTSNVSSGLNLGGPGMFSSGNMPTSNKLPVGYGSSAPNRQAPSMRVGIVDTRVEPLRSSTPSTSTRPGLSPYEYDFKIGTTNPSSLPASIPNQSPDWQLHYDERGPVTRPDDFKIGTTNPSGPGIPLNPSPNWQFYDWESEQDVQRRMLAQEGWGDRQAFQGWHGLQMTKADMEAGDRLLGWYGAVQAEVEASMAKDEHEIWIAYILGTSRVELEEQYKRHWLGSVRMMEFGSLMKKELNEAEQECEEANREYFAKKTPESGKRLENASRALIAVSRGERWVKRMQEWAERRALSLAARASGCSTAPKIVPMKRPAWPHEGPRSMLGQRPLPPHLTQEKVADLAFSSKEIKSGAQNARKMSTIGTYMKF